jgi:DivIVA domain-containing protein
MEVAPKLLREVEFPEKLRGYHPDHVDEFLEQVAVGIEQLQERLRQAIERAEKAEQRAEKAEAQLAASGGEDDLLRRTLVLAQKTADMAIAEANERARAILEEAEQRAEKLLAEAQARAQALLSQAEHTKAEAEAQARAQIEEGERSLQEALGRLAAARNEVASDLARLRQVLAEEQKKAIAIHMEAIRWLEGAFGSLGDKRSVSDIPPRADGRPDAAGEPASLDEPTQQFVEPSREALFAHSDRGREEPRPPRPTRVTDQLGEAGIAVQDVLEPGETRATTPRS